MNYLDLAADDEYSSDDEDDSSKDKYNTFPKKWRGILPRSVQPEETVDTGVSQDIDITSLITSSAPNIKVELVPAEKFSSVWKSQGSESREKASVWAPKVARLFKSNKTVYVCIGHHVVSGFSKPDLKTKRYYLSLTDKSSYGIMRSKVLEDQVINCLLPHPIKYTEVWRMQRQGHMFFAWQPVPPSNDFVALGNTDSPNHPDKPFL